jgi:Flp pilus assembly protein TadB
LDSEAVKEMEMFSVAERKASQYAPPPAVDPTMGGCCGAFFAVAVIMIFSAVAGFEAGGIPIIVTVAIFFILPILYLNSQQKRYRKAILTGLELLTRIR